MLGRVPSVDIFPPCFVPPEVCIDADGLLRLARRSYSSDSLPREPLFFIRVKALHLSNLGAHVLFRVARRVRASARVTVLRAGELVLTCV